MRNVNFAICSLIIFLIILIQFGFEKRPKTAANRFFNVFTVFAMADILLNIFSALFAIGYYSISPLMTKIFIFVFHLVSLTMPFLLMLYTLFLRHDVKKSNAKHIVLMSLPYAFILICIILNIFGKFLYSFDLNGNYVCVKLYSILNFYGIIYLLIMFADVCSNRKKFRKKQFFIVCEFIFLNMFFIALQFVFKNISLTNISIAVSFIIALITINNPLIPIDSITGLQDITILNDVLEDVALKENSTCAIIIALDNLKRINLVFGMDKCNLLLQNLADRFVQTAGRRNVFHFIGDRFFILCPNHDEYTRILADIKRIFDRPYVINEIKMHISACICTINGKNEYLSQKEITDFADYLILMAKKCGKGTILEADNEIIGKYTRRKHIEEYLCTAINENLFDVYYQPIYSLNEKAFTSAEALVRLHHPKYGLIMPSEFIPIAESNGEISPTEVCIFKNVCSFISRNPQLYKMLSSLKVNLSPSTFLSTTVSEWIQNILDKFNISPKLIQFEITETAATIYNDEIKKWSDDMQKMNINICLDDFGSGYANLDSVMTLPFGTIKMDYSMLVNVFKNKEKEILYKNLVKTFKDLGFSIVAEGAETKKDVEFLIDAGVDYIQGFYFSPPLAEKEFIEFLNTEHEYDL